MSVFEYLNLGNGFRKYFRIDAAVDDALRDEVNNIRHQVYCEELKYEPERPDHRETDEYDAHSLYCLLRTVHDPLVPVGRARLVTVDPAHPDAPLPFERLCADTIDRSIVDPARLPRERIAEVSRLAVRRSYRRRKGEDRHAASIDDEDFGTESRPRFPYILVGLYMGALSLAVHQKIDKMFVLTEPRLAKNIARLGVEIQQIGPPVSHRGTRVPSVIDVKSAVRGWNMMLRPLWRTVDEEINASFR